jgi:hypothetical protein
LREGPGSEDARSVVNPCVWQFRFDAVAGRIPISRMFQEFSCRFPNAIFTRSWRDFPRIELSIDVDRAGCDSH